MAKDVANAAGQLNAPSVLSMFVYVSAQRAKAKDEVFPKAQDMPFDFATSAAWLAFPGSLQSSVLIKPN